MLTTAPSSHIEVNAEHNANLFFWQFQSRHIANRQRTVLWLNGGPGCSSEDGALMEIGPYRLKDDSHLTYNPGSWDEFANLLFVDNPVGTGFSYVNTDSYLHELKEMADNMVIFLKEYYSIFPEHEDDDVSTEFFFFFGRFWLMASKLYIAGESYAGQHIPYIARAIVDRNNLPTTKKKWNLSGLLIGNGWVAPEEQSYAYLEMAYKAGIVQKGTSVATQLEAQQTACKEELGKEEKNAHVDYPACEKILNQILQLTVKDRRCVNMYDVRLDDDYPSCGMNWPPDLKSVTPYLRRPEVVEALHVGKDKKTGWTECTGSVSGAFRTQNSKPAIHLLPDLLSEVPVLLFSGDKDLICNHIGTENLIRNMQWQGGKGFELSPGILAPRRDWTFEGEPAGIWQEARNLTYVLFYNSSHMVPFDYPRRTRDMLDRFMNVDIASIGGVPTDSRIDGEKGIETSVGGHPNSTAAQEEEKEKIDEARWSAYYRSGTVALIVVAILATGWGWYVWRDRRRSAGYEGLFGSGSSSRLMHNGMHPDVEAGDFDESELDDLHVVGPEDEDENGERYADKVRGTSNGRAPGSQSAGDVGMNGHAEKHTSGK